MKLFLATATLGESAYLDETIASVAVRDDVEYTLICPASATSSLKNRFPRLTILSEQGRNGIYGALNEVLEVFEKSNCTHFSFINDDDTLEDGFWKTWQDIVDGEKAELVFGRISFIDMHGHFLARISWLPFRRLLWPAFQSGIIPITQQGTFVGRRLIVQVGHFDLHYRLCADSDWFIKMLPVCKSVRFFGRHHANYRLIAGQLSSNQKLQSLEMQEILKKYIPLPRWKQSFVKGFFYLVNLGSILKRILKNRTLRMTHLVSKKSS